MYKRGPSSQMYTYIYIYIIFIHFIKWHSNVIFNFYIYINMCMTNFQVLGMYAFWGGINRGHMAVTGTYEMSPFWKIYKVCNWGLKNPFKGDRTTANNFSLLYISQKNDINKTCSKCFWKMFLFMMIFCQLWKKMSYRK